MKQENEFEDACEYINDVPVSAVLLPLKPKRYGSVPGLEDDELADPYELERQVMMDEWGPILALPVKSRKGWVQPNVDEDGSVDFGAFGTVDFDRMMPEFDKARYKADKLREQVADLNITIAVVSERIQEMATWQVLKYLVKGIIQMEHIVDEDTRILAGLHMRASSLLRQIGELEKASRKASTRSLRSFLEG
jgi:hypothetical protein